MGAAAGNACGGSFFLTHRENLFRVHLHFLNASRAETKDIDSRIHFLIQLRMVMLDFIFIPLISYISISS